MTTPWEPRIAKQIHLGDSTSILLMDMLDAPPEVAQSDVENNICRVRSDGRVIWRVSGTRPAYARSPFTGITVDETGHLVAYNWDGGKFQINTETGEAKPVHLAR
jgi:hypothetical protein